MVPLLPKEIGLPPKGPPSIPLLLQFVIIKLQKEPSFILKTGGLAKTGGVILNVTGLNSFADTVGTWGVDGFLTSGISLTSGVCI